MSVKDLAFETLRVTVDDMLLTVTLDDTGIPLNLFTWQRMEELGELMSRLRDETAVRAIVLTGSGRYLSGGGSFDLFATLATSESAERMAPGQPQALQGHARGRAADRLRRERPGHRRRVLAGSSSRRMRPLRARDAGLPEPRPPGGHRGLQGGQAAGLHGIVSEPAGRVSIVRSG